MAYRLVKGGRKLPPKLKAIYRASQAMIKLLDTADPSSESWDKELDRHLTRLFHVVRSFRSGQDW